MVLLMVYVFYLAAADFVSGNKCDKHGILIYEDLGCTAEYCNDEECPIRYLCKGLKPSNKNCYFRGKRYENEEQVNSSLTSPSCHEACFCDARGESSYFSCASLDCAEWLQGALREGCYRTYTLDHCCSAGVHCIPPDKVETCVVEGKEYKEGEKFYPSNTCLNCVCKIGFKGKFEEPFCRRRLCGQQLQRFGEQIQKSCAPLYGRRLPNEVLCCPYDWICPDGSEIIKGDVKSGATCKFGNTTLKVGQQFEKLNFKDDYGRNFTRIKCECKIPPLVKCTDV